MTHSVDDALAEATVLLERVQAWGNWPPTEVGPEPFVCLQNAIDAFLSRAPAQPAAQAWHVRGKSVELGPTAPEPDMPEDQRTLIDSYLGQPAAPEPSLGSHAFDLSEMRAQTVREHCPEHAGWRSDCDACHGQPAAPEPSADERLTACLDELSTEQARRLAAESQLAAAQEDCNRFDEAAATNERLWMQAQQRACVAESQLAAVREAVSTDSTLDVWQMVQAVRIALTPAPSPEPRRWPGRVDGAVSCNNCARLVQDYAEGTAELHASLAAAESQLAAARKAVDMARREHPHWPGWEPILSALTPAPSPAPSPGAGECTEEEQAVLDAAVQYTKALNYIERNQAMSALSAAAFQLARLNPAPSPGADTGGGK